MMGKRVMVAMSGGVDSSVTALLLKDAGHEVVGATMCLGAPGSATGRSQCCGIEAVQDARRVCDCLGIRHYVFDFAAHLENFVVDRFVADYRCGRTPNPCVECNRTLKFDLLLAKARGLGFDALATGHYARVEERDGDWALVRPRDRTKDQTYFLYVIPRAALPVVLFPLADFVKSQARDMARAAGLPVAEKAESQDICFVQDGGYQDFLAARGVTTPPGEIVDTAGKLLGRHTGITNYTVGQRKGLGIATGRKLFVVAIDSAADRVVVGERDDLTARGLAAGALNMLYDSVPAKVSAAVRYSHAPQPCDAEISEGLLRVLFHERQEAVTPGQSVVLYEDDRVVGGGVISDVIGD